MQPRSWYLSVKDDRMRAEIPKIWLCSGEFVFILQSPATMSLLKEVFPSPSGQDLPCAKALSLFQLLETQTWVRHHPSPKGLPSMVRDTQRGPRQETEWLLTWGNQRLLRGGNTRVATGNQPDSDPASGSNCQFDLQEVLRTEELTGLHQEFAVSKI